MSEPIDTEARDVDLAAERLLGAIEAGCESALDFPGKLDAALGAAFALLATEPDLIPPLTSYCAPEPARAQQHSFCATCAARLRAAAESAGSRDEHLLPLVETFLVAAVKFEASRALFEDKTSLLPGRAPDFRDLILGYYASVGAP
ncbi:MAG TPA: hypothetical protein VHU86_00125 [Solirubrobacterales bacterium]|jgi:hypothetical protein|nr:hypothetical protein [Solirubrobacterales bacterium]